MPARHRPLLRAIFVSALATSTAASAQYLNSQNLTTAPLTDPAWSPTSALRGQFETVTLTPSSLTFQAGDTIAVASGGSPAVGGGTAPMSTFSYTFGSNQTFATVDDLAAHLNAAGMGAGTWSATAGGDLLLTGSAGGMTELHLDASNTAPVTETASAVGDVGSYNNIAIGEGAIAKGIGSQSIGAYSVTEDGTKMSVALGNYSVVRNSDILPTDTAGVISVGAAGMERRIINVAPGVQDTDAATMGQLRAVETLANSTAATVATLTSGGGGGGGTPGVTVTATRVSVGTAASASVDGATAIGPGANASAANSTAVGNGATVQAAATGSVALGSGTTATRTNVVEVGGRQLSGLSDGTEQTDAVTVRQLEAQAAATAESP